MSARLNVLPANKAAVTALSENLSLPEFMCDVMVSRGIDTPAAAQAFLHPNIDTDWLNPYGLAGMEDVVEALTRSLQQHQRILVFGDFDLDGISATSIMARGLRELGGDVVPFIPLRFEEGYGLTQAAINRLLTYKPDVLITVDNGIAAKVETKTLQQHGIEVLITDHHEPAELVPEGVPVVDPKNEEDNPSAVLSGAGVALKVIQALGSHLGQPNLWRSLIDLATLGTIADLMPMTGENRALVAHGVAMLNEQPRVCIAALMAQVGMADKPVTSTNLSFTLIPRLNAAGRMGNAQLALDLLMCDDYAEALALATELEQTNTRRRTIEAELAEVAFAQAEETFSGQRALVVSGEGWHEGVKGIVASRLCNTYGVPSILFTIDGDEARGSGRSVGDVNLFKAVESCKDLLIRFGGHEAAVGVTLPANKLPEFSERLCAYMDTLSWEMFQPRIAVDSVVDISELTVENVSKLDMLAPFGQENPTPHFLAQNVCIAQARAVGADKNHLSCTLTDGTNMLSAIMFHCDAIAELTACSSLVNAVFELQIDTWRGTQSVKAMLSLLEPVVPCEALTACLEADSVSFVDNLLGTSYEKYRAYLPDEGASAAGGMSAQNAFVQYRDADYRAVKTSTDSSGTPLANRAIWEELAAGDTYLLRQALISAFLGEGLLHKTQQEALNLLDQGQSVLAVMGTGRGKSLIFQVFAAECALQNSARANASVPVAADAGGADAGGADAGEGARAFTATNQGAPKNTTSLILYPLRALIADQAYYLQKALQQFGISVVVLSGESRQSERVRNMEALRAGRVDIVLTTPEYAIYHKQELLEATTFNFIVIDEAHHIATSTAGFRNAYKQLGAFVADAGNPVVLALSATVDNNIAAAITQDLPIQHTLIDDTARTNLEITDCRNIKKRLPYLANLVASGQKTIVYVNSRMESVVLTRQLRQAVPQMAPLIGFYNAGLSRAERKQIEEYFRNNTLQVLIATSAFGEGVNIPSVRNVVLYHLPFSEVEFNQMSGRAGRDGQLAHIHLLYGRSDATLNRDILQRNTPDHDTMAQVYRELRREQRVNNNQPFTASATSIVDTARKGSPFALTPEQVLCGLQVFSELGLIEVASKTPYNAANYTDELSISVIDYKGKVELTQSVRYCEGLNEAQAFEQFRKWALQSDARILEQRIQKPMTPSA